MHAQFALSLSLSLSLSVCRLMLSRYAVLESKMSATMTHASSHTDKYSKSNENYENYQNYQSIVTTEGFPEYLGLGPFEAWRSSNSDRGARLQLRSTTATPE